MNLCKSVVLLLYFSPFTEDSAVRMGRLLMITCHYQGSYYVDILIQILK